MEAIYKFGVRRYIAAFFEKERCSNCLKSGRKKSVENHANKKNNKINELKFWALKNTLFGAIYKRIRN